MNLKPISILFLSLPAAALADDAGWLTLFNGKDLTGWTTTLQGRPPGEDPDRLVQVREGVIHMYADTAEGTKVPFGVITHEKEFSNFQLHLEYKWLGKKFPPREKALRDAGLIYHVKDAGSVWPPGVECQIQEGDTGDLVYIKAGGLTWMRPDPSKAPEGQGLPGMLPEQGGFPVAYARGSQYIGRFPESDKLEDWNEVDVVVHGSDYAEHTVNGQTRVRVINLIDAKENVLSSGKLCLQLEGAELVYRNVRIREIAPPVATSRRVVSLSAVKGQASRTQSVSLSNPRAARIATPSKIIGADADSFKITASKDALEPGQSADWTIAFTPTRGAGRYSAGIQIGEPADGAFIILQGIGLAAFEGENEPALQEIAYALGIPLDAGGKELSLDTKAATIGASVDAPYFVAVAPGKVRVTPLARFSPPGPTPIGIFTKDGGAPTRIGQLSASTPALPDAHQTLLPPWDNGTASLEIDPGDKPFGFSMEGHHFISFTDPTRPTEAKVPRTARVYPVKSYQGRPMTDAWLVCFEEAANGDYQDAVILVENAKPAAP